MNLYNSTAGVFNALGSVAQSAARYLPEPVAKGIDFATSLTQAKSTSLVDISPDYRELIERQIETQAEMQQVTFTSNIERAQHEARMAAVRNIRVS